MTRSLVVYLIDGVPDGAYLGGMSMLGLRPAPRSGRSIHASVRTARGMGQHLEPPPRGLRVEIAGRRYLVRYARWTALGGSPRVTAETTFGGADRIVLDDDSLEHVVREFTRVIPLALRGRELAARLPAGQPITSDGTPSLARGQRAKRHRHDQKSTRR